jgi:hypothetical protein
MLREKPAFTYKPDVEQKPCMEKGLTWNKMTGCDSRCATKGKSFNAATKQCEWDEEPEEEEEDVVEPAKPMAVAVAAPVAKKSKCQMGTAVQKAMARFADAAGLQCKTSAVELVLGVAATATLLGSAL